MTKHPKNRDIISLHGLLSATFGREGISLTAEQAVDMFHENADLFTVSRDDDPVAFDWVMDKLTNIVKDCIDGWQTTWEPGLVMELNALLMMPKSSDITTVLLEAIDIDALNKRLLDQPCHNLYKGKDPTCKIPDLTEDLSGQQERLLNLKAHNERIMDFYEAWMLSSDYAPSVDTLSELSTLQVSPERLEKLLKTIESQYDEESFNNIVTSMLHAQMHYAANFTGDWRARFDEQNTPFDDTCEALWAWAQYQNTRSKMEILLDIVSLDVDDYYGIKVPRNHFYENEPDGLYLAGREPRVMAYLASLSMINHVEFPEDELEPLAKYSHDKKATLSLIAQYQAERERLEHDLIDVHGIDPFTVILKYPEDTSFVSILMANLTDDEKRAKELDIFTRVSGNSGLKAETEESPEALKSFSI